MYNTIRNNEGWENWSMIEIEKYPCNDINEACSRERYYYELLNAKLNTNYPTRNGKEYYQDNKEYKKEYSKEYREYNKIKINAMKKLIIFVTFVMVGILMSIKNNILRA